LPGEANGETISAISSRRLRAKEPDMAALTTAFSRIVAAVALTASAPLVSVPAASTPAPAPTFTRDVLPILQQSCQTCHRPNAMAPMSLLTYDEVRPWARAIKQRVAERAMPPWFSKAGVGEYEDDPSLSPAQIATIVKWVDGGAPQGNPADAPSAKTWQQSGGWKLGTPDLVVSAPPVNVPISGPDEYPELDVPTGLTEDRYLQSIEIVSENDPVVHHVIVYTVEAGAHAERGDEGLRGATHLANLAKGGSPDVFAPGTARLMRKATAVRFQLHLHPNGKSAFVEHTKVGFRFFPKGYVPAHLLNTKAVSSRATLVIPPMEANVRSDARFKLDRDATLVSFQPHMHYRGKRMTLEAELPSGEVRLLSDIDRFQQGWQLTYRYKNPLTFPAGTVLHVTAYHDNSPANRLNPDPTAVVTWGERTIDEMNIGWIDYYYLTEESGTPKPAATSASASASVK
jgi:mono/diheme cytochrome c family protein